MDVSLSARSARRIVVTPIAFDQFRGHYRPPSTNNGTDRMAIRHMAKFCSVAAMVILVILALGPANWTPRSGLGWEIDHFVGYFGITLMFCFAWPRPIVVGGALMVVSGLLEGLQALTPDRSSNLEAAFWGAGGALAAALLAELFIRARRRRAG
jgi:hypothetical protein